MGDRLGGLYGSLRFVGDPLGILEFALDLDRLGPLGSLEIAWDRLGSSGDRLGLLGIAWDCLGIVWGLLVIQLEITLITESEPYLPVQECNHVLASPRM